MDNVHPHCNRTTIQGQSNTRAAGNQEFDFCHHTRDAVISKSPHCPKKRRQLTETLKKLKAAPTLLSTSLRSNQQHFLRLELTGTQRDTDCFVVLKKTGFVNVKPGPQGWTIPKGPVSNIRTSPFHLWTKSFIKIVQRKNSLQADNPLTNKF